MWIQTKIHLRCPWLHLCFPLLTLNTFKTSKKQKMYEFKCNILDKSISPWLTLTSHFTLQYSVTLCDLSCPWPPSLHSALPHTPLIASWRTIMKCIKSKNVSHVNEKRTLHTNTHALLWPTSTCGSLRQSETLLVCALSNQKRGNVLQFDGCSKKLEVTDIEMV